MNNKLHTFGEKMTRGVFLMSLANVLLVVALVVVFRHTLISTITEAYVKNISDYVKDDIRYTLLVGDDVATSTYLDSIAKFPLVYDINLYDAGRNLHHSLEPTDSVSDKDFFKDTNNIYSVGNIAHLNQPVYTQNRDGDAVVAGYIHIAVDTTTLLIQANKFMYLAVISLIIGSIALAMAMRYFAIRESNSIRQLNEGINSIRLDADPIVPIKIVPDSIEIENVQREFNTLLARVSINKSDLEHKVRERTAELADAMEASTRAEAVRRSLIMNLSHDLKTPLSSNMMYLDHAIELVEENRHTDDDFLPLLRKSRNSSLLLRDEIKTLLLFSSISDIKDIMILEEFDVTDLIEASVSATSEMSRVSSNEVIYHHEGRTNFVSSRRLITFVFDNLLTNAHKACQAGIIKIRSIVNLDGVLSIIIHDSGIGIPQDEKEHIYEKHFQVNAGSHAGPRGMGIGLSLVSFWIDQLGGKINVKSEEGEYTEFTIMIEENKMNKSQQL